jgi:hypothetical protein
MLLMFALSITEPNTMFLMWAMSSMQSGDIIFMWDSFVSSIIEPR